MLFGDDFPTIVSKQADLSRGLAKNLSSASRPGKRPRQGPSGALMRDKPSSGACNEYLSKPRKKRAFLSGLQTRGKRVDSLIENWRAITSDPEILSIVLGYNIPLRCKPVQFSLRVMIPRKKRLPDTCRSGEPPCKRSNQTDPSRKRGSFFS